MPLPRVVSLVPCLTESVVALGARRQLVGATRYCVHPAAELQGVVRAGGVRDPDLDAIARLRPDVILVDREENCRGDVAPLGAIADLFVADVSAVADVPALLRELGDAIGHPAAGLRAAGALERVPAPLPVTRRALVVVWPEPLVLAGGGTYMADVLRHGGVEVVPPVSPGQLPTTERYPRPSIELARSAAPALVVLPTEPYAFSDADVEPWRRQLTADVGAPPDVRIVSGEDLCWYGARTAEAVVRVRAAVG